MGVVLSTVPGAGTENRGSNVDLMRADLIGYSSPSSGSCS